MKNNSIFVKAALLSLLPILAGVLLCALNGTTLWNVYLPASEWNDELFYYKQVEAIIEYGIPQGFFGYNEGTAKYLSFATWNPLIMLPYVIWGAIFGWNLYSPILCNMILMMLAIFVFVWLTKPDKRQCLSLAVLYLSSMYTTRFCLSGMAETIMIFWGILFGGFCISYQKKMSDYKLVVSCILVLLMTMGRPYFLILALYPGWLWFQNRKWKGIVGSLLTIGVSGALYVVIAVNLCAPYLWPSLKTYWLKHYEYVDLIQGLKYTIKEILKGMADFVEAFWEAIISPKEFDGLVLQLVLVFVVLIVEIVFALRKKKTEECLLYAFWTVSLGAIMTSMFLMYYLAAGRRHFVVFVTMTIFLICFTESKHFVKILVIAVLLCGTYCLETDGMTKWKVPAESMEIVSDYENMQNILENGMTLKEEGTPSFDNTVLWVMQDYVNEELHQTRWQMLYAVPKGFGINCCLPEYVEQNFEQLQCRYLATICGGSLDIKCMEAGIKELTRTKDIVIYVRY